MEYDYQDIEACIVRAQEMRSKALGDLLSAGWTTCVSWLKSHAQHLLHKNVLAAKSTVATIY